MFSVSKIGSSAGAAGYFGDRDGYYRNDTTADQWIGSGARMAGLRGQVDMRQFKDALDGKIAGQQVGTPGRHAAGWDGTFSAPKDVSIAGLVGGDRRVIDAHDAAVKDAMQALEKYAGLTRQRDGAGGYVYHETGNLVGAAFRHSSNRDNEPQLHTHVVMPNATFDPTTGQWRSVWSRDGLYRAQREANVAYIASLARRLRGLGYDVEWRVNADGHPTFSLGRIPDATRELYSQRTAEIDAKLREMGTDRAHATPEQKEMATLATRKRKEPLEGDELHERWDKLAREAGINLSNIYPPAEAPRGPTPGELRDAAGAAVKTALDHLSERDARFTPRDLETEAQVAARGRASLDDIRAAIGHAKKCGELLDRPVLIRGPGGEPKVVPGHTTRGGVETETRMLDHAISLADGSRFPIRIGERAGGENTDETINDRIEKAGEASGYTLSGEQQADVHKILGNTGGLNILQGHAGTAKTTGVLAGVAAHAREGGWEVRAIAPTHDAADTLGNAIGERGETLASYLAGDGSGDHGSDNHRLLIVDEAGMISARDMRQLLERADRSGDHLILSGDVRQIGSVGAGRALDQLERALPDTVSDVRKIVRQQNDRLRQAVYAAIDGRGEDSLNDVAVRERKDRDASIDGMAREYMRSRAAGKDTLAVTLSRRDALDLNAAIQRQRADAGEVHDVRDIELLRDKQWTAAQARDASRYQPGDVIQSHRDFKHLRRGEVAAVSDVRDGKVTIDCPDGSKWSLRPDRVKAYSVLDHQRAGIGIGDDVAARGTVRAKGADGKDVTIRNGERLRVTGHDDGRLHVRDAKGRDLAIDTSRGARIDLDYASTANRAQGRTADHVVASMRSGQARLADMQHFYVIASRARERVTLYTDDKQRLADQLGKTSGQKSTALEKMPNAREFHESRERERERIESSDSRAPDTGADREPTREVRPDPVGTPLESDRVAAAGKPLPAPGRDAGKLHFASDDKAHELAQAARHTRSFERGRFRQRASWRDLANTGGVYRDRRGGEYAELPDGRVYSRRMLEADQRAAGDMRPRSDSKFSKRQAFRGDDGHVVATSDGGRRWHRASRDEVAAANARARERSHAERKLEEDRLWREADHGGKETAPSRELAREALETHKRGGDKRVDWKDIAARNGVEYDRDGGRYARDDKGRLHAEVLADRDRALRDGQRQQRIDAARGAREAREKERARDGGRVRTIDEARARAQLEGADEAIVRGAAQAAKAAGRAADRIARGAARAADSAAWRASHRAGRVPGMAYTAARGAARLAGKAAARGIEASRKNGIAQKRETARDEAAELGQDMELDRLRALANEPERSKERVADGKKERTGKEAETQAQLDAGQQQPDHAAAGNGRPGAQPAQAERDQSEGRVRTM